MVNTVCIETSGAYCSVAAQSGAQQAALHEKLDRQHNQHLLRMLDEVCRAIDLAPLAVERVLFGAGPGSFTGIRLGASAAQALALTSNAALGAVPSSLVLARSAWSRCPDAGDIITCIPSRAALVYVAWYGVAGDGGQLVCRHDDELNEECPAWLAELATDVLWAGAVPTWALPDEHVRKIDDVSASAADMMALADAEQVRWGEDALPRYLQGDSPWLTTAERAARA